MEGACGLFGRTLFDWKALSKRNPIWRLQAYPHSSVGTVTFGSRQWQETDRPFGTGVPGVKAAERVSGESSSFSAEVKHEWRSAFSSPYAIVERHLNTGTNLHFPL